MFGGEVEKDSIIALPGKGGLSRLRPSKAYVPTWERLRSFIVIVQRGSDWLSRIFFWWGGGEVRSLHHQPSGPTGLGSTSLWAAYHCKLLTSPTWKSFNICKIAQRYCVYHLMGKQDPAPRLLLAVCFSLVSPPIPSLINNCLNLPIGTQGRSWKLNEGCFL